MGNPAALNHAQAALLPTTVSLLLCVDPPGSNFPCGKPHREHAAYFADTM